MFSSWLGGSKSKATKVNDDNDDDDHLQVDSSGAVKTKGRLGDGSAGVKPGRVSRSWLQSPWSATSATPGENNLEGKSAQHNLLDVEASGDPITSSSILQSSSSKRFRPFLEDRRISTRPLYIVRQSDSDILRFKEDHFEKEKRENQGKFISIPILPADEMNSLTSEIKLWHKSRKSFKVIFIIAMICGLTVFCISALFTLLWYNKYDYSFLQSKHFGNRATMLFNFHMNGEVLNLLLMGFGLNIFRLFHLTKLTKVILYHALALATSFALSLAGIYWAIYYHHEFTQINVHFYSLHSWIGLASYILYIYCFITGFLLLYYPGNKLKDSHSSFAILTFMLVGAASIAGFFYRALLQIGSSYGFVSLPCVIINCIGVLIVLFCIFIRLAAASFVYRRRPKPQWDVIVYRSMEPIEDVYLEIYDMYDTFELWVKQVNQARLKALKVPHTSLRSSIADSSKSNIS